MAYPDLPQMTTSSESRLLGRQVDRATNGKVKVRVLHSDTKKVFDVKHELLTGAQKSTLQSFYDSNSVNSFDFVWTGDGLTYNVVFGETDFQFQANDTYWSISIQLLEV